MSIGIGETGTAYRTSYYQKTSSSNADEFCSRVSSIAEKTTEKNDSETAATETENANAASIDSEDETTSYSQMICDKIQEIFTEQENGNTEPAYQIGGQIFTEKEEAAKSTGLLSQSDSAAESRSVEETVMEALVSESTRCTYPSNDSEKEDKLYITWYTEDGIFCREEGQTEGYLWSIEFTDKAQYNKVMEFLKKFNSDDNLRFASDESFWRDFLDDKIDEDDFIKSFKGTNNG